MSDKTPLLRVTGRVDSSGNPVEDLRLEVVRPGVPAVIANANTVEALLTVLAQYGDDILEAGKVERSLEVMGEDGQRLRAIRRSVSAEVVFEALRQKARFATAHSNLVAPLVSGKKAEKLQEEFEAASGAHDTKRIIRTANRILKESRVALRTLVDPAKQERVEKRWEAQTERYGKALYRLVR